MLERHKLLMGRTQDRAGQNNGSIGVFWRSFNGIIGHIRYMFRGPKITHNHEHSSLYQAQGLILDMASDRFSMSLNASQDSQIH